MMTEGHPNRNLDPLKGISFEFKKMCKKNALKLYRNTVILVF